MTKEEIEKLKHLCNTQRHGEKSVIHTYGRTIKQLIAHIESQEFMESCANTPLMRDVMRERDEYKKALGLTEEGLKEMSAHTLEPWTAKRNYLWTIHDKHIGRLMNGGVPNAEDMANARRIVACVNACKSLPTELLEGRQFKSGVSVKILTAPAEFFVLQNET